MGGGGEFGVEACFEVLSGVRRDEYEGLKNVQRLKRAGWRGVSRRV